MKSVLFALAVMTAGFVGSKAEARPCVDGTVSYFTETDASNNDRHITVARTCVNGRYYPYKPQPLPRRCEEGMVGFDTRVEGSNDRSRQIAVICRGGKYVPLYPEPRPFFEQEKSKCENGETRKRGSHDPKTGKTVVYREVCVKGRYVLR